MKRLPVILFLLLLLPPCCTPEEQASQYEPALRIELQELTSTKAVFTLLSIDAARISYGYSSTGTPGLTESLETASLGSSRLLLTVSGLEPGTDYLLAARGIGPGGEEGSLQEISFRTEAGPEQLYPWEKARSSIPLPADMTLIPGHSSHRSPLAWEEERWQTHVSYTDGNGREHWLFDCFLLIEGQQTDIYGSRGYTYVVSESSVLSAPKELWQQMLDFWFDGGRFPWQESYWGDGSNSFGRWYTGRMVTPSPTFADGQLSALDACIRRTASRIGEPPSKRYVVMCLPEPIYFENYIASVKNPDAGNTRYWGTIDGREMDFSKTGDRIEAYRWFIDLTRAAFARKNYSNIELLGFYILPEVLDTKWRNEFKEYGEVIPAVAKYLHSCNEGLFWIPYNMAEGYRTWKDFGIDMAYMQPNYYWDENGGKPMDSTFDAIRQYGMGLELEFEYSMVEGVNGTASAKKYRERFAEYLKWAKSSGIYGTRPIALYSGTDAMHQLASSSLPGDREAYLELCQFISESPLRAKH